MLYRLKIFPSILNLLRIFNHIWGWFCQMFFPHQLIRLCVFLLIINMAVYINFSSMNYCCIAEINPTWLCHSILFMCCWILFTNCWEFLYLFLREIDLWFLCCIIFVWFLYQSNAGFINELKSVLTLLFFRRDWVELIVFFSSLSVRIHQWSYLRLETYFSESFNYEFNNLLVIGLFRLLVSYCMGLGSL